MSIIYTDANTGRVVLAIPTPKAIIETWRGKMTDAEYDAHIWSKLIPADAINPRVVTDADLPDDPKKELFNAWLNVEGNQKVHVDAVKAKHALLNKHADEVKLLSEKIALKQTLGDDVTAETAERDAVISKRNALKAIDVSKVDHKKDLASNNAKLAELKGVSKNGK